MRNFLLLAFAASMLWMPGVLLSEEIEEEYSYGVVTKIEADKMVVREYNDETGEEIDITYSLKPETKYDHAESGGTVAAGDDVDITYVLKEGEKVATAIEVVKLFEDEMPLETLVDTKKSEGQEEEGTLPVVEEEKT